MVINKFPNREIYKKIRNKGILGADDINVLENYSVPEWKGEYSFTAVYNKGDIVYYENMLYVMVSSSVIGAIPGIDDDWVYFANRSVTSSDVTNALGFTPADSTKVLPLSGGTLTGNLTGKYIIGTWLQATDAGHLTTTPTKISVFDDKGWIYYRTPAEILKDIGASSGYTLTGATVGQIAKITAVDASGKPTAWAPVDMPSGGGGGSSWTVHTSTTIPEDVAYVQLDGLPEDWRELCILIEEGSKPVYRKTADDSEQDYNVMAGKAASYNMDSSSFYIYSAKGCKWAHVSRPGDKHFFSVVSSYTKVGNSGYYASATASKTSALEQVDPTSITLFGYGPQTGNVVSAGTTVKIWYLK